MDLFSKVVDFKVIVENNNSNSKNIHVAYISKYKFDKIQTPEFKDFSILSGPNFSALPDGFEYSYILKPKREGELTVAPIIGIIGNKSYVSSSTKINFKYSNPNTSNPNNLVHSDYQRQVFIRLETSKTKYFINEPIVANYYLYYNKSFNIIEANSIENPNFNRFNAIEIKDIKENPKDILIDNQIYGVILLKRTILYANINGNYNIPPLKYKFVIDNTYNSPEDYICTSESKDIECLNLPIINNFNGLIGEYDCSIDNYSRLVYLNKPFELRIQIKGKGNLHLINTDFISLPQGLEFSLKDVIEDYQYTDSSVTGSKTFVLNVRPTILKSYKFVPVKTVVFNPSTNTIIGLTCQEIEIQVEEQKIEADNNSFNYFYYSGFILLGIGLILLLVWFVSLSKRNREPKQEKPQGNNQHVIILSESDYEVVSDYSDIEFLDEFKTYISKSFKQMLKIDPFATSNLEYSLKKSGINSQLIKEICKFVIEIEKIRFSNKKIDFDRIALMNRYKQIIDKLGNNENQI